jgi:hypothetical protein
MHDILCRLSQPMTNIDCAQKIGVNAFVTPAGQCSKRPAGRKRDQKLCAVQGDDDNDTTSNA